MPKAGMKQGSVASAGYGETLERLGCGSAPGPYTCREINPCRGEFKTLKLSYCSILPGRKSVPPYTLHKGLKKTHPQCPTSTNY